MYKIDVPTYHWDYDQWQTEIKVLSFAGLDTAKKAQSALRNFEYTEDELLQYWGLPERYRNKKSHDIPLGGNGHWIYERLGVYHGVIVESDFRIYSESTIRTYWDDLTTD